MFSGSETIDLAKDNRLLHNLEISSRSKLHKENGPRSGDKQVRDLAKQFDVCVISSVHGFHEYLIPGTATIFVVCFRHLKQLRVHLQYLLRNTSGLSLTRTQQFTVSDVRYF
jgi:hypothetical protein